MKPSTLLIVLLALATGGCGSMMSRAPQTPSEVEELKRRVLELQKQSTVHELEIERLRRRLEAVEAGGAGAPPRRVAPPPSAPPSASPSRPVNQERPRETYRRPEIDQADLDVEGFGQPVDPPLDPQGAAAPPSVAVRAVPPPGRSVEPTPQPRMATDPVPAAAQALYDEGYTLYHQGRFVDAESAFRRFLQSHGNTDLADNAQYWIGESRYARKDYQAALAAFRETVERYPDGNKVPDALIKAGQCFEALGDTDAAAETYREVVRRFPRSAASVAAAEYLEDLR